VNSKQREEVVQRAGREKDAGEGEPL